MVQPATERQIREVAFPAGCQHAWVQARMGGGFARPFWLKSERPLGMNRSATGVESDNWAISAQACLS